MGNLKRVGGGCKLNLNVGSMQPDGPSSLQIPAAGMSEMGFVELGMTTLSLLGLTIPSAFCICMENGGSRAIWQTASGLSSRVVEGS